MSDSPSLPLNQILHGSCLELLVTLPDQSVDLIFADPPYNLQLQQALYRPNMSKVDAVDDEWDRFDSLAAYDAFTRAWLGECRRVLKDTGTIWVIGSYHNIYRVGSILQDLNYWLLNDVVWVKCLAGDTELLTLVNGQPIVSTLKDLIRIDLASNSIELPSYDDQGKLTWVDLTGWQKAEKARGLRLELEDGSRVECTPEHRFPVARNGEIEMVVAQELVVGEALLQLGRFEIPHVITSQSIDEAVGELVGWYLAQGSLRSQNKGLQFSMAADERAQAEALIETVREKFGVVGQIYVYKNALHLKFSGRFMVALMKRFVRGDGAKKKRLTREAFWHGLDFVRGILQGYLQGDGHWDKKNQRWRLGLAPNRGLITDLGVICRLLGYRLRVSDSTVPYQQGRAEVIRGEVRENADDRWSSVSLAELGLPARRFLNTAGRHSLAHLRTDYKLLTRKNPITEASLLAKQVMTGDLRTVRINDIQSTTLRTFYDLSVSGKHVFALANGLLTHNSNPMPNFRGVRFTNAHETLLWAQKCQGASYTFNYQAMKSLNDGLQMRSDWNISLCTGKERLRTSGGQKAHPTQKPEALLYRVLLSSSKPGDVVLDPFFGTGTTGAVAKTLHRNFIGIEKDAGYVALARERIEAVQAGMFNDEVYRFDGKRALRRVAFGALVERGLLQPGQTLYFGKGGHVTATILANGQIKHNGSTGSIHEVGRAIQNAPCNGWEHWYYFDATTQVLAPIDKLREIVRAENGPTASSAPGLTET